MTILITLIKTFLIAWAVTKFDPFKWGLELVLPDPKSPGKLSRIAAIIINAAYLMVSCLMCASFWTSLLLTHNVYIACLSAFIGFWYDRLFYKQENFTPMN